MANGDEWALDGPGWEEGHSVINGDLLKPWLGRLSAARVTGKWASAEKVAEHDAAERRFETVAVFLNLKSIHEFVFH